ncbi:MAG: tRNA (adenosine(37)-N6)-threonylcarbamoyltransferase complex ATPase subunit type 1 TsaE [Acidimicrobiales bacterium]
MISLVTKSGEDTRELGAQLASVVRPGDVVLLTGDLGAGKTTLAQGFGLGLGVTDPIVSPTFTLVRIYQGRLTLVHCDAYRLDRLDEVEDLGLAELLEDGAVGVVEWGEVVAPTLPADYLEVRMEIGPTDGDRRLALQPVGLSWTARRPALKAALGRWSA